METSDRTTNRDRNEWDFFSVLRHSIKRRDRIWPISFVVNIISSHLHSILHSLSFTLSTTYIKFHQPNQTLLTLNIFHYINICSILRVSFYVCFYFEKPFSLIYFCFSTLKFYYLLKKMAGNNANVKNVNNFF